MIIEDLFNSLYQVSAAPDNARSVYGKQVVATEEQVKALVALSHVFPQRLTRAIAAIESGHCARYECGESRVWVVELVPVCLSNWVCSCKDFETQLDATPPGSSRWKRACRHLLAAHILENEYPIINHDAVRKQTVSVHEMVTISLEGTVHFMERLDKHTDPATA